MTLSTGFDPTQCACAHDMTFVESAIYWLLRLYIGCFLNVYDLSLLLKAFPIRFAKMAKQKQSYAYNLTYHFCRLVLTFIGLPCYF